MDPFLEAFALSYLRQFVATTNSAFMVIQEAKTTADAYDLAVIRQYLVRHGITLGFTGPVAWEDWSGLDALSVEQRAFVAGLNRLMIERGLDYVIRTATAGTEITLDDAVIEAMTAILLREITSGSGRAPDVRYLALHTLENYLFGIDPEPLSDIEREAVVCFMTLVEIDRYGKSNEWRRDGVFGDDDLFGLFATLRREGYLTLGMTAEEFTVVAEHLDAKQQALYVLFTMSDFCPLYDVPAIFDAMFAEGRFDDFIGGYRIFMILRGGDYQFGDVNPAGAQEAFLEATFDRELTPEERAGLVIYNETYAYRRFLFDHFEFYYGKIIGVRWNADSFTSDVASMTSYLQALGPDNLAVNNRYWLIDVLDDLIRLNGTLDLDETETEGFRLLARNIMIIHLFEDRFRYALILRTGLPGLDTIAAIDDEVAYLSVLCDILPADDIAENLYLFTEYESIDALLSPEQRATVDRHRDRIASLQFLVITRVSTSDVLTFTLAELNAMDPIRILLREYPRAAQAVVECESADQARMYIGRALTTAETAAFAILFGR